MKILFVASELYPYAKVGGLGDVSSALPKAIQELNHEINVFIPFYKQINRDLFDFEKILSNFSVSNFTETAGIYKHKNQNTDVINYFIDCHEFYNRDEIYDNYEDNSQRFIFFSKAVLEGMKILNILTDIIHCNDWQSAAIPILLKTVLKQDKFYENIKVLYTIHNLAFQGIDDERIPNALGIKKEDTILKNIEFWDKYNLMKGAIYYSDIINTVSESYAREIQTDEFGFGLKNDLISRSTSLYGILNGIDYDIWNPDSDKFIWKQFNVDTLQYKKKNKEKLLELSLNTNKDLPLFGMITRLTSQKGLDLLMEIFDDFMKLNTYLIILGTGQQEFHELLSKKQEKFPNRFKLFLEYNEELAHKIEAGSDIFLMPSRFEPCGLNQMISLKYGTIPIVRAIGGLNDSIIDIRKNEKGNGFSFLNYSSVEFLNTIKESIKLYANKPRWNKLMINAMNCDFSWKSSAFKYEKLYKKLTNY
ncbi:MAG: glycogen synthase [Candidatus Lokiarchaeota archaeon]|nr:glycogen synthase [Candidatus Lokiarchaeota archaeon]